MTDNVVPLQRTANYGKRRTLEQRLNIRAGHARRNNRQDDWADEALDYFLSGIPVPEIAAAFDCGLSSVYNVVARAALYRLMKQHQAERLEEFGDLSKG